MIYLNNIAIAKEGWGKTIILKMNALRHSLVFSSVGL